MSVLNESKSDVAPNEAVSVDEKLDHCVCLLVECYEEILRQRSLLNECLDAGFLNLSKARSLLGCASLSILQVPSELDAAVTIDIKEQTALAENYFDYKLLEFDLKFSNAPKSATSNGPNQANPMPSWFGVLTPMSLKTSHKSFANSLYLIKSISELQNKLTSLKLVYKRLLSEK